MNIAFTLTQTPRAHTHAHIDWIVFVPQNGLFFPLSVGLSVKIVKTAQNPNSTIEISNIVSKIIRTRLANNGFQYNHHIWFLRLFCSTSFLFCTEIFRYLFSLTFLLSTKKTIFPHLHCFLFTYFGGWTLFLRKFLLLLLYDCFVILWMKKKEKWEKRTWFWNNELICDDFWMKIDSVVHFSSKFNLKSEIKFHQNGTAKKVQTMLWNRCESIQVMQKIDFK